jgi:hypothetical protein
MLPSIAVFGSYSYIADQVVDSALLVPRQAIVDWVKAFFDEEAFLEEMTIEAVEGLEQLNSLCEPEVHGGLRVVNCSLHAALPPCIIFSEYTPPVAIWSMEDLAKVPRWIEAAEAAEDADEEERADPDVYAKICLEFFWKRETPPMDKKRGPKSKKGRRRR